MPNQSLTDLLRAAQRDQSRRDMTHDDTRRKDIAYTREQARQIADMLKAADSTAASLFPQMDRGAELTEEGWKQVGNSPEQAAYSTAQWLMPSFGLSELADGVKAAAPGVLRAIGGKGGSVIKDWRWRPEGDVRDELGLTEVPEYIQSGFGRFMEEMAQKAKRGDTSARDLIKAYTITRSSIQRQGQTPETLLKYWPDFPLGGDGKIRPEGAFSEWLLTPGGQNYLNAAERGDLDIGAVQDAMQKMTGFGKQNDLAAAMADATRLVGQEGHVGEMVGLAYDRPGSVASDWREFIQEIPGVSSSKAGFIGSLLGKGDLPTLDSRQLVLHTGRPSKEAKKYQERMHGLGGWQGVDKLAGRQERMGLDVAPELSPFYQHLAHHSVWDKTAGEITTHDDLKRAMLLASNPGATSGLDVKALRQLAVGAPEFRQMPDDDLASALAAMRSRNTGKGLDPDADTGAVRDEIARRNAVSMLGLPDTNTAADRAGAMGHGMDAYHGRLADYPEIDLEMAGSSSRHDSAKTPAFWAGLHPKIADLFTAKEVREAHPMGQYGPWVGRGIDSAYFPFGFKDGANTMPLQVAYDETADVIPAKEMDALLFGGADDFREAGEQFANYANEAIANGASMVRSRGHYAMEAPELRQGNLAIFDPARVRSRFAAFDPARRGESNLLAGVAGGGLGLAQLYQLLQAQDNRE